MGLKKMFKSKKLVAAIAVLAFMSGTALAQSQPPLPPQNQPGQNTGPASQDQGQPGQKPKPGQQQPGQQTKPGQQQEQYPKPGQQQPGQQTKPGQQQEQYPKPGQQQPGQQTKPGQQQEQYPKPGQQQPGQQTKPGQQQEWQHQPKPGQQQGWQSQPKPQPQNQQKAGNGGFEIKEMLYKPDGRLQIRLDNNDIRWNRIEKIIVRDSRGRVYNARVNRTDRDIIELIIAGMVYGENYSIEIPGVRYGNSNYILRGDFWASDNWRYNRPDKKNIVIQSIRYQNGGRLKIKLYNPRDEEIRWNRNARVIVRDNFGRRYDVRIEKARYSTIELTVFGIRSGDRYTVEIPGIRYMGRDYVVKGDFWARHNWSYDR